MPINLNVPQPPMGGGMQDPGQSDALRAQLDKEFGRADAANKQLDQNDQIFAEKLRKIKIDTMKQVFDMFKKMGIDPSNVSEISDFLQKLEEQDPDLVTLLEFIFDELDPEKSVEDKMPEPNLMDQASTDLQQGILQGGEEQPPMEQPPMEQAATEPPIMPGQEQAPIQ